MVVEGIEFKVGGGQQRGRDAGVKVRRGASRRWEISPGQQQGASLCRPAAAAGTGAGARSTRLRQVPSNHAAVRLSVCPSVRLFHRSTAATAAGGFAAERRAGRIDTLICGRRRSTANAGSVMLSAEEGADLLVYPVNASATTGDSVAEWLACWTQAQKGLGSNRSRDAVG